MYFFARRQCACIIIYGSPVYLRTNLLVSFFQNLIYALWGIEHNCVSQQLHIAIDKNQEKTKDMENTKMP